MYSALGSIARSKVRSSTGSPFPSSGDNAFSSTNVARLPWNSSIATWLLNHGFSCASRQRTGGRLVRTLAKTAGVRDPDVKWRLAHEKPWFNNQVAWLELDGRRAKFVLQKALPPDDGKGDPVMERVFERAINAEFARA